MKKERFYRVNERIRFSPVVVIDEAGTNYGEMSIDKARAMAQEQGLDLVEINPTNRPPICKIMDYGKYKYDQSKLEKKNKARQKGYELKEVRLTAKISDHDLSYKAKQAYEFLIKGDKVKVSMRLRGRENVFVESALGVFGRFAEKAHLEYEKTPLKSGSQIVAMVGKVKEDSNKAGNTNET